MAKIRIIAIPSGQAPEHVRKQWVGVEIEYTDVGSPLPSSGVLGGPGALENQGGYEVETRDAIAALRTKGRAEAADWWQNWYDERPFCSHLVFGQKFCQVVP